MFDRLREDIACVFERDPAARTAFEIVTTYPGFHAVLAHRLSHWLWQRNLKWLARVVSNLARWMTGIEIHPGAQIGRRFFIDHGMGVVIGETAVIGDDCTLYHGVTLGAKSFPLDELGRPVKGVKRHPNIGSRVVIYANAVILGGDTHVGDDSVIGGNVWLTRDVPPGATISQSRPTTQAVENGGGI